MPQSQKKPHSSEHKEKAGLKVTKSIRSRPAGSPSSNMCPAPPPGEPFTYNNVTYIE